jgi:integrase
VPADARGKDRKRRNPVLEGPRLFKRGRWWAADLRPWGGARPTLRDPAQAKGERTDLRDVARQWAEVYVARLTKQTHDRQRSIRAKRPLEKAVEEYLRHRQSTVERNTWDSDLTVTGHLVEAFGNRDVHGIGQDEVQAWFDKRASSYAPKTLALYAIHARTFFSWAGRPLQKITLRKGHTEDPDALSDAEVEKLLAECRTERENLLVRVGLATGCRKAELWALEWSDFRQDGRSVRIQRQIAWPGTTTKGLKGKRNRTALVLPGFMEELERKTGRVMPGWVLNTAGASEAFERVLTRAGLAKVGRGHHVMRHTYSRIGLESHEWSLEMLKLFLGHQSIKTTEVYAHFAEEVAVRLAEQRTYRDA